jgi:hypothetical protein
MYSQGNSMEKKIYNSTNLVVYGDINNMTRNQNDPNLYVCDNHPTCGAAQKTGYNG